MGHPILLIEDDPDLSAATAALLTAAGHTVTQAGDAAQALSLLEDQHLVPCLVLLDLVLPGMSGAALFARMKARPELADVPVLVITGAQSVELPAQITAVLRKPVRPDRLLAVVDGLCGNTAVGRAEIALRARALRMGGTRSRA